jgi:MFS family permease
MSLLIRYLSSAILARLADEGARVGLILLAFERTSTASFGGLLVAAFMLPHVLAAPLVGALADRTRHPRLVHASGPILFGAALALVSLFAGRLPTPLVLIIAMLGGIGSPLVSGGLSGVLRHLIPAPERPQAYGLDVATYSTAAICGPALAATLASTLGSSVSVYALGGLAALGGALAGTLPLEPNSRSGEPLAPWRGVAHVWQNRRLRAVTVATAIGQIGLGGVPIAVVLLAQSFANQWLAGYLLAAIGVGALVGSLGYARYPIFKDRPELMVWLELLLSAIPLALVPWVGPWPAAGFLAIEGLLSGPGAGAQFAVRDRESPRELNTEIFAVAAGLKISMSALGAALAGAFAGVGPTNLMLACAVCQLIGAAAGLALLYGREARSQPSAIASTRARSAATAVSSVPRLETSASVRSRSLRTKR